MIKQITANFQWQELSCPCCNKIKILPGLFKHMQALERLRLEVGFPIIVNSGYRCKYHNNAVGGMPRSWHRLFATDIRPMSTSLEEGTDTLLIHERLVEINECAESFGFKGIGQYETFIHLDMRPVLTRWRD